MWFRKSKQPPSLSQELVERIWDLSGRLKLLEDRIEQDLALNKIRFNRAEQSERRLEKKVAEKRQDSPCLEQAEAGSSHPAFAAARARRPPRALES